ncbi:hypothetical protein [Streptomyces spiramenti]|uniref:Uncharacterized protein n=1 Tax=Streptomyces spiramenti TaxID=2720606 RepID=A0ABX1AMH5_9ACTN|nr:hypothetical protein [Streptomyces spiramenti]NJP65823.1 hypothetical protein [Streptomyces spiramenti]
MRLRSAVVAGTFAVAALAGSAGTAFAGDHGHLKAGYAYETELEGFTYKNIGGPWGITEITSFEYENEGAGYINWKR